MPEPIPNAFPSGVAQEARAAVLHVGLGVLERVGCVIHDSFVLFSDTGTLVVRYRLIDPGWHGTNAGPAVYREGTEIAAYDHPQLGRVPALLCGDRFDDDLVRKVRDDHVDLLFLPFGRASGDGSVCQERWEQEEHPYYADQIRKAEALTLMVNYIGTPGLGDSGFGGAWVVGMDGSVRASVALGREGLLVCDLSG
ncbi:MAG TPA: nitrilase-related carbon-nitrogen hydrolase [Chthonomonadales bacterium]|nr:nitrilase-related carbon-nitrogen hydrolase [Chthonomonadales bacterium]